jgi:hypothetical protein
MVRPQILGRIAHDVSRTAVRNLVRAGVDEAPQPQTRAVFDRNTSSTRLI